MSLLPQHLPRFTPDAYYTLEQWVGIEETTGERYEYHDGHLLSVEAMAGGSPNHSRLSAMAITLSGIGLLGSARQFSRCDPHTSDLRIAVDGGRRYLYADAVIVCGAPVYDAVVPSAIVNPVTVFEVLSPSSEGYDRGLKFEFYAGLDTLREYVLIDQERRRVELRHRPDPRTDWRYETVTGTEAEVPLPSFGFGLPMGRLYRNWEAPA